MSLVILHSLASALTPHSIPTAFAVPNPATSNKKKQKSKQCSELSNPDQIVARATLNSQLHLKHPE